MKAGRVADLAFKKILVGAADSSPEPDEYADFITGLNSYMASLEVSGIVLGYTPVNNVNDELTVPDGAIHGLIANMAIVVAPEYDAPISSALAQEARSGMDVMRRLGRAKMQVRPPSTLPIGSGNYCGAYSQQFYGRAAYAVASLKGNAAETEIAAIQTPAAIRGQWNQVKAAGMRSDVTGRITSLSKHDVSGTLKATLNAIGDDLYTFQLLRNNVEVLASMAAVLSATPVDISLIVNATLAPDDFLSIKVMSDATTNPVTVQSGKLEFR